MTELERFDAAFDMWFDAGWAVFKGDRAAKNYPPVNDMIAQGAWLCGFRAAWVAANGEALLKGQVSLFLAGDESIPEGAWAIDETLIKQLAGAVQGCTSLPVQLQAIDQDSGGYRSN